LGPSSFVLIIAIKAAAKQRGPRLFFSLCAITTSEGDKNTKLPPSPPTPRGVFLDGEFRQKAEIKNSKKVVFDAFSRQQEVRKKKK